MKKAYAKFAMLMPTEQASNIARLRRLCQERVGQRRLIVASNRGPIEYQLTEAGELQARRGSGGVITAFSALSQYVKLTWIAGAMGEGDRRAEERAQGGRFKVPMPGQDLTLRFVVTPRNTYHKYYNIFCNPLLWFLQHYMWNSPHTPNITRTAYDAWENGYIPVNRSFAQAVLAEAAEGEPPPLVMLQDYHLYLAASYIRQEMPHLILQHFTHIPWPAPSYWQLLPRSMRQPICEGLCLNDIVGLQTMGDVRNFLSCCESFLPGAEVDHRSHRVLFNKHLCLVNAYPVSVEVVGLQRICSSARVQEYDRKLRPLCGEQTVVRVDRAEPSKNILRGFRAFELLLERYPELVGKVKFLAFLTPTRTHVRQYQRYMEEVYKLVGAINAKYETGEWRPIEIFYENNYAQAIAGMRLYDALIVNAVADGMNLVAKEGPVVNDRNGVLILSEAAGAHEQLGEHALSLSPADLEATMQALHDALTMPAEERARRAAALKKTISEEDVTLWLYRQIEDLINLAEERPVPTS